MTSPHSIEALVEKHKQISKHLEDTLNRSGRYSAREIIEAVREHERNLEKARRGDEDE